jgi:hypothetical protein
MSKISFLAGLAAGYVLGSRAGHDRYEQIKQAARSFAENPTVQQAAGAVQAQATGLASTAGSKISERVPGLRHNGHGSHETDSQGSGGLGAGSASSPSSGMAG